MPEISREEIAEEIYSVFCFDVWPGSRTLAFRLTKANTLSTRPRRLQNTQTTITQATCLHLQRFREGKDILLQVHSLDCLVCNIKGKTKQATKFRKTSVTLVWRHVACKENNCSLKISVMKTYWTIGIVYAEECGRRIAIKANCCSLSQIV